MSTPPKTFVTPEEYLERERKAKYKSEYSNGEVFAMSGVSRKHDDIATELHFLVAQHLRGRNCRWHTSDMRVLLPFGDYTYPDVSVVCGERKFADSHLDILTNPTLLIEILSPSTENYDRGRKAKMYREIPSLRELLLIAQDEYEVELSRRQADGTWLLMQVKGLDESIELASINYTLKLRDLYAMVIEAGEAGQA